MVSCFRVSIIETYGNSVYRVSALLRLICNSKLTNSENKEERNFLWKQKLKFY